MSVAVTVGSSVAVAGSVGVDVNVGVIVAVGSSVAVAVGVGVELGVEVLVAVGVDVAVAVAVGVNVLVGVLVGVCVGVFVAVGVGLGVNVAVGVGVNVGPGMQLIVRTGRSRKFGFSRLAKRLAVVDADSSPTRIHPKLVLGASSHPWTSAVVSSVEPHTYPPVAPTDCVSLAPLTKSPPAVVQLEVEKTVWIHVTSPADEAAPPPSCAGGSEGPSLQSERTLWREMIALPAVARSARILSDALLMVEAGGQAADASPRSKRTSARRMSPSLVRPAKR